MRGALSSAPARYLGARSYSVYLLHLPVMQILTWVIVTHYSLSQNELCITLLATAIPATFLASELLYRIIELPMINLGARLARRSTELPAPAIA